MKTLSLFGAISIGFGMALSGCATTPEPATERNIVLNEDGSFLVLDENDNPVDDENLQLLGKLLSEGLAEAAEPEQLTDEEIWSVDAEGNLTHIQSGGICPFEWGEFRLIKPSIFKRDGSDVGCNFQSASLNASFTFYFYRNAEPIDQELNGIVTTIQSRTPTAREAELNFLGPEPHFYSGRVLETVIDGGGVKRDAVLITDDSGWRIKLRMTYSAQDATEREHLGALMLQGQADRVGYDTIGAEPEQNEAAPDIET